MKKEKRFDVETIETSGSGITTVVIDKNSGVQKTQMNVMMM